MSLVSTLGKIAMGVMVAKTVGKMVNGGAGAGGLGGLLGGLMGNKQAGGTAASEMPNIGDLLGGKQQQNGGQGSLGGMLDSLGANPQSSGGLGNVLNDVFNGNAVNAPSRQQEDEAKIMLRAMLAAAKSDGKIEEKEHKNITQHLGELSAADADFIRAELAAPVDAARVAKNVPRGMENQVYLMSLLAIDLDSQEEARYLDGLARELKISNAMCDSIHAELGVPKLYS